MGCLREIGKTYPPTILTPIVSEQTFYRWRRKYEGMTSSEAAKLRKLEVENTRLKKLVVERDLEIEVMKEIAAKKW